jgi:hypothetical protein
LDAPPISNNNFLPEAKFIPTYDASPWGHEGDRKNGLPPIGPSTPVVYPDLEIFSVSNVSSEKKGGKRKKTRRGKARRGKARRGKSNRKRSRKRKSSRKKHLKK